MIKPFSTRVSPEGLNLWLLIARLLVSVLMVTHGLPKLQNAIAGNFKFGDPIGIGPTASLLLVVFAEVVCSFLLMLGLATRFATLALLIDMVVAAFIAHSGDPFGKKELSFLYLVFYLGLLIMGPGRFSIDQFIGGKTRSRY